MCESAILNERNAYPLNNLNRDLAEDQKILEEYEDHIKSGYVSDVLPYAMFKRLYVEFQELLDLDREWTEDEDRRVSELSERLGY